MRRRSGPIGGVTPGKDREFVQVVSRAIDVMRCFDGSDQVLGNKDISQRTGLAPSTVSRLTYTLACIGHLSYLPALQRYRLGAGAIAMSSALLRGLDLRSLVRPVMQDLAERVPGTVGLTVRDGADMVFLEYARSARAVGLFSVVGTRVSLPLSAAGRAYVAALPAAQRAILLAELDAAMPKAAARLRAWLTHGVPQLEHDGFVVSCREWNPHISGLAIPLFHAATQSTFVLGIGVLASVFDDARLCAEVAPLLLDASARIAPLLRGAPETECPAQPAWPPSRSASA